MLQTHRRLLFYFEHLRHQRVLDVILEDERAVHMALSRIFNLRYSA
ncbi:hypothetical protein [Mitsuokella sp.]